MCFNKISSKDSNAKLNGKTERSGLCSGLNSNYPKRILTSGNIALVQKEPETKSEDSSKSLIYESSN